MLSIKEDSYNRILHDLVLILEKMRKECGRDAIDKDKMLIYVKNIQKIRTEMLEIIIE